MNGAALHSPERRVEVCDGWLVPLRRTTWASKPAFRFCRQRVRLLAGSPRQRVQESAL